MWGRPARDYAGRSDGAVPWLDAAKPTVVPPVAGFEGPYTAGVADIRARRRRDVDVRSAVR